jgi:hypothetical protein
VRALRFLIPLAVVVAIPTLLGLREPESAPQIQRPKALQPYAKVRHSPIAELSGIVKSRRYPDTYWVHNDSGHAPSLFAIRADGTVIMPEGAQRRSAPYRGIRVDGASNRDWEDIAIDGDTLYVADLGNNGNARRDLGIYVIREPNPQEVDRTPLLRRIPVAYPDQESFPPNGFRPFDCEAVFFLRGKLYVITKERIGAQMPSPTASLYRLDTQRTEGVNTLTKLQSNVPLGGWVTAADVSPDGRTLAVLTQMPVQSVWLFGTGVSNDRFLAPMSGRQIVFANVKQAEAICWENNSTLIIANEQGEMFRLSAR